MKRLRIMAKCFPISVRHLSHVCNLKPYKDTKWLMPYGNPTGLYVYNCVAGDKVPIILNDPNRIATWYSCGPTVYDSAHVGHASCYVKIDIIQRILQSFFNIKLVTAMGITDIDDKIIKKANDTETDFRVVAKQYEHEFWLDMSKLNVRKPQIITKVSDHISTIEHFVHRLIDSGSAYIASDGSVYFDTNKYSHYGKLQKQQESTEIKHLEKKSEMDFALWKGHKPDEPYWQASWGKGRPGWHIECSAMVSKVFGSQLDFHAGGIDLQFPHHENEEAQSCSYHSTKQWANYWIHVGHLHFKGDTKMSKSLQNTISIPQLLESYSADTFRMACLMSHYRYTMEYCDEMMETAEEVMNKIKFFLKEAQLYIHSTPKENGAYCENLMESLYKTEEIIMEALSVDFDTSKCINTLLNLISNANRAMKSDSSNYYPVPISLISDFVVNVLNKFGLILIDQSQSDKSNALIDILVDFRHSIRKNAISKKDKEMLMACDIVRDKMKSLNIQINDYNQKSSWVFNK